MSLVDRDGVAAPVNRMIRRVMGAMMLSLIDRSNVGYARLQMAGSLGMSETM